MYAALAAEFRETGLPGEVSEFIRDMPGTPLPRLISSYAGPGAGAVSELAAAGKPSILVPFPFAADQHQLKNAEAFQRAGAALYVAQLSIRIGTHRASWYQCRPRACMRTKALSWQPWAKRRENFVSCRRGAARCGNFSGSGGHAAIAAFSLGRNRTRLSPHVQLFY